MGKRRAIALAAVHVLIAIHIAQWIIMGSTLSPVEPSESMKTLELGVVNAGFVFFTAAILSTLLFGRFFCGWGCHVVALQDACAWVMKKLRAKPKPFRSRLLLFAPLLLGLYMFVWPTFKRFALIPGFEAIGADTPAWIGRPADVHGFQSELIAQDFWATFPPWYIAIPFLAVCGFACVYFLGSKGFCAYGCPYGGIFGVVDRASPGRIVVNDSCEGCGHCTAVCTSNVRVHEEVRDFGAVVSPACMKCLDCVSACPKDALSFALTKPALLIKPRDEDAKQRQRKIAASPRRYDLSWPEEVGIAAVALLFFLGFRGMLNLIPMLMAVGMALVAAYLVWAAYRTITTPNVRLQSFQLKLAGRVRAAGIVVVVSAGLIAASAGWSLSVNWLRWSAHLHHESLDVPVSVAFRPEYDPTPDHAASVETAIARYERSSPPANGGLGWSLRPQDRRELAFLYLLDDRAPEAIHQLERLAAEGEPTAELVAQAVRLRRLSGQTEQDIAEFLARTLEAHPTLHDARIEWSRTSARLGTSREAIADAWEQVLAAEDTHEARLAAAQAFLELRNAPRAVELAARPAESPDADMSTRTRAGRLLAAAGDLERARAALLGASETRPPNAAAARDLANALAMVGERARARALLDASIERFSRSPALREARALLTLVEGDLGQAMSDYAAAVELVDDSTFALAGIGETIVRAGLGSRNPDIYEIGIDAMARAAEMSRVAVLHHDLGQALLAGGRRDEAILALETASRLAPGNGTIRGALDAVAPSR